jgi:hypothetical protein
MFRIAILLAVLFQAGLETRPTIVAKQVGPPHRNVWIIYYDDSFLFASRNYGSSRDYGGNTEPGLFVHSKKHSRWIQILQISTAGGRFGKSWSDNPEVQKKMLSAAVGWDFTGYAKQPYIDQPLRTSGSIAFPDLVRFDSSKDRYELRYFSGWKVPSAETVLYVNRKDIIKAVIKQ